QELFGRHIRGRARKSARVRGRCGGWMRARSTRFVEASRLDASCQSEIGDADPTARIYEHILRLEVAMHDARNMRRREAAACLHEHLDDRRLGARPLREPLPKGLTFDELHGQEHLS